MKAILGPYMQYFLWSLALGVMLAVVYDILRITRRIIPTCDIVINIEDICFLLISGVASVLLAYAMNNGILRVYALGSTALAFAIYRLIAGTMLVDFMEYIYRLLSRLILYIADILLLPLRLTAKLIRKPILITISAADKGFYKVLEKVKSKAPKKDE